jgi:hypothetical protein
VLDTFRREALQKPQRITPSFSTSQLFFHNDLSRRSLLGRDRDIESRYGHSPRFCPASNEAVNTCQLPSPRRCLILSLCVNSSVNAESSSISFKALVSSTILYFGWPIAASVLTSRGISFDLLRLAMVKLIERLVNGPCMLARLSLRTREPADALII